MTYVIKGAPRTKKNHQRIARRKDGVPFILQAKTTDAWTRSAVLQLRTQHGCLGMPTYRVPVRLSARVYREKAVGDLLNYLAAVSDALEAADVVENDRLIVSLDGSQLLKDAANPRVELEIREVEIAK